MTSDMTTDRRFIKRPVPTGAWIVAAAVVLPFETCLEVLRVDTQHQLGHKELFNSTSAPRRSTAF
jgi:hypothetical protein